jgi:hypothetical protein
VVGSKVAEVVVVGGAELEVEGFGVGRQGGESWGFGR